MDILKKHNDISIASYISKLNTEEKRLYFNVRKQMHERRQKKINAGCHFYHTYTNTITNIKYAEMIYYIDRELIVNEKYNAFILNMCGVEYFIHIRNENFKMISKQISDTVGALGPEVYYLILQCNFVDKATIKQCALVSKRFLNELSSLKIKVLYGFNIKCFHHCGNKMYIDANTIFYYSCIHKTSYNTHILNGIPKCPICLGNYVRMQPDDTIQEYIAWNKCNKCHTLFIDGMFKGDVLKCKKCRGNKKTDDTNVTIKNDNFIW